jgi:hypothetical protein
VAAGSPCGGVLAVINCSLWRGCGCARTLCGLARRLSGAGVATLSYSNYYGLGEFRQVDRDKNLLSDLSWLKESINSLGSHRRTTNRQRHNTELSHCRHV